MVYFTELLIIWELFLIFIIGVDVSWQVVVIGLAMDEGSSGKTVGEGRFFSGPADGQCGDGHDELRKLEDIYDLLWHIDRCAKVTIAKPFFVGKVSEGLREEQGVGGSIDER